MMILQYVFIVTYTTTMALPLSVAEGTLSPLSARSIVAVHKLTMTHIHTHTHFTHFVVAG